MKASHPPAASQRWWLWIPLLGLALWLALFGDTSNQQAAMLSLPTRQAPALAAAPLRTADPRPAATPTSHAIPLLIPRADLIAPSGKRAAAAAAPDLFAARNWSPPPAALPPVAAAAAPVAPPLPFSFLGKKLEGDVWEVYLARGEQTFIVRQGQVLEGSYRVDKIAPPTLALTYLPLNQPQTLAIGDTR